MRLIAVSVFACSLGTAGCAAQRPRGTVLESTDEAAVYVVGRVPASADSVTIRNIFFLTEAAREIADSTGALPRSVQDVLRLRRKPVNRSPQQWMTIDGWGRPIQYSLQADERALLLLSLGRDGAFGGGDDRFDVVRLR